MEVHYIGSYRMHPDSMAPPKLHGRVRIGLPELHGRIRIDLPELHRRFRIDPPQVFHSIWSH